MMINQCPTCGKYRTRSNEANRRYWALVHLISEKLQPQGEQFSYDTWHIYLKGKFLGYTDVKLPNGVVRSEPNSTAKLDIREFSDYLDKVQFWASEHGVWLPE